MSVTFEKYFIQGKLKRQYIYVIMLVKFLKLNLQFIFHLQSELYSLIQQMWVGMDMLDGVHFVLHYIKLGRNFFYQTCVFVLTRNSTWLPVPIMCSRFKTSLVKNHKWDWFVTLKKWLLDGHVLTLWMICWLKIHNGCHNAT